MIYSSAPITLTSGHAQPSGPGCGKICSVILKKVHTCVRYLFEKIAIFFAYLGRSLTSCFRYKHLKSLDLDIVPSIPLLKEEITPPKELSFPKEATDKDQRQEALSQPECVPKADQNLPLAPPKPIDQRVYSSQEIKTYLPHERLPTLSATSQQAEGHSAIDGRHCDPKLVDYATVVNLVRECVAHRDRNGLRAIAQTLFTGPWEDHEVGGCKRVGVSYLFPLMYDPDADLLDIARLLLFAFKEWRVRYTPPVDHGYFTEGRFFLKKHKKNLPVSYGGGLSLIQNFLEEKTEGYAFQYGGSGLQVSLIGSMFDASYANSRALSTFDIPAVLSGNINYKYLININLYHEAGLPASSVSHLRNPRVRILPIQILNGLPARRGVNYDKQSIKTYATKVWHDRELGERVHQSVNRICQKSSYDSRRLPFLNEAGDGIRAVRQDLQESLKQIRQNAPGYFAKSKKLTE